MIDYAAAQKSFTKHKAALTRAKNTGDPQKVVQAVDAAFGEWERLDMPFPDSWHTWNVARNDAQLAIAYGGPYRP